MSQIDAVIFDIGNVLLTFDYFIAERALVAHTGIKAPPSLEELHPLRMDHETGRIPREDFVKVVREAFAHDGPEDHFMELWTRIFEVNTQMVSGPAHSMGKNPSIFSQTSAASITITFLKNMSFSRVSLWTGFIPTKPA